jgi:hypothetical protein
MCKILLISIYFLQAALPTAVIFTVLSDSEDTDTADEEESHSENLTFAEKVKKILQMVQANSDVTERRKAFETLFFIPENERTTIEVETRLNPQKWKDERIGRLTASNFGKISKCKTSHESLLYDIMGYHKEVHTQAIAWGKKMERVAQEKFFQIISPLHVNLCIQATGLFVDKDELYLGATPDGIMRCDCCEDFTIEIKCPYAHREKNISEIEKKNFFLDENGLLKESHNFYDQVQGQMALTGTSKCYFVTFTEKELHHQIIDFDALRWENTKEILRNFFFNTILPEILSGEAQKAILTADEECICNSKKIGTIIKCINCKKTFHRSCISGNKYRKQSDFLCNTCKIK